MLDLQNGVDPLTKPTHSHRALLHNVGHGIKEMAGNVINTPIDLAKSVKRNVFGSADNLAAASEDGNFKIGNFKHMS